jgi:hypothetical protein
MDPRRPHEYTIKAAPALAVRALENHHDAGLSGAADLRTW